MYDVGRFFSLDSDGNSHFPPCLSVNLVLYSTGTDLLVSRFTMTIFYRAFHETPLGTNFYLEETPSFAWSIYAAHNGVALGFYFTMYDHKENTYVGQAGQ